MARLVCSLLSLTILGTAHGTDFKAGVAVKVITPPEPIWMAGYAARTKPAEGKVHDLHVKALALEDAAGGRLVLVTSDLCGIGRDFSAAVAEKVHEKTGLPRGRLMLTVSHTHSGPVVYGNLTDMYPMPPGEMAKVKAYTAKLNDWMAEAAIRAIADLKPAKLSVGDGKATFAKNRRETDPEGKNPKGPVDHSVPVLKVTDAETGALRAVAFGYACHNTTMSFQQWCGDYAGFAQAELEKRHPGCAAMFWTGCGADANPLPRRELELCVNYGTELSDAVDAVLGGEMDAVEGSLRVAYREISLPFADVPGEEKWRADLNSDRHAVMMRAKKFLALLDAGRSVPEEYAHYPVQVWQLGGEATWISLGGEVVVDYSHRLKRELGKDRRVWVAGYANDVMAYIGSARVIREGGYEGDTSMVYYGMPGKWDTAIEEKIVNAASELVQSVNQE